MTQHPQWVARLDATRPKNNPGFTDLLPILAAHYRVLESAEKIIGPYNAKQRSSQFAYMPPSSEMLKQLVRQGQMNDITYNSFINSLIRFCAQSKGQRALPTPHPSTIHSIQLGAPAFSLKQGEGDVTMVYIAGTDVPLHVKGLRNPQHIKFIIARPKLSKLGTASSDKWEILFFKENPGYIVDWCDSALNPRYSGTF